MKIASWNVNSLKVRLPHVLDWLDQWQPDVLAIQETKLADDVFPTAPIHEAGWNVIYSGQKTYNGVAIISGNPATEVLTDPPGVPDEQRRILAATVDGVRIVDLYVPNGQTVDSDKYRYKLDWMERVASYLERETAEHERLVVLGDFNIAPTDADVYDADALRGQIHCTERERAALKRIREIGLDDTFRLFDQPERSFSWWDYRANAFRRGLGLRIDLILASRTLAEGCTAAGIDPAPRGKERPSDHAPIFAEFS